MPRFSGVPPEIDLALEDTRISPSGLTAQSYEALVDSRPGGVKTHHTGFIFLSASPLGTITNTDR